MAEYKAIIDDRSGAPTHGKWVVTHADGPRIGCLASLTGYASRDSAMRRIRAMKAAETKAAITTIVAEAKVTPVDPQVAWAKRPIGVYPAVRKNEYRRRWAA